MVKECKTTVLIKNKLPINVLLSTSCVFGAFCLHCLVMRHASGLWRPVCSSAGHFRGGPSIFLSLGWGCTGGRWDGKSSSARRVSQTASQTSQQLHAKLQGDFKAIPLSLLCWEVKDFYSDLDEDMKPVWTWCVCVTVWLKRGRQTLVGSRYPPPSLPQTLADTHRRAVIFHPAQWGSDRSGRGSADWQDWHLHIVLLIMGICLDTPVWRSSRVHGCCHRDGGEPLVVWGADRDPVILLRGGQTWPPVTLLFWVGWETVSSQPGEKQRIPGPADWESRADTPIHCLYILFPHSQIHDLTFACHLFCFFLLNGYPANHRYLFKPPV